MATKLLKPFEPGLRVAIIGTVGAGTIVTRVRPGIYRVKHPRWDARWPEGVEVRRALLTPETEVK